MQGEIRYEPKTPYRDGTTHIIFDPLDFISKLAALVPVPRVHLASYHGVFAPNNKHRSAIIPKLHEQIAGAVESLVSLRLIRAGNVMLVEKKYHLQGCHLRTTCE